MADQTNYIYAVVAYDNRQPLEDDISNSLMNLLHANLAEGGFYALGVTVNEIVMASMQNPTGGTNGISIQLVSPEGTTEEAIIAWVTAAILELDLWTSPYLSVISVVVTA